MSDEKGAVRSDPPKLCWLCKHFLYSNGSPGYSEWTPGWSFHMECGKLVWSFDPDETGQSEFGRMLQSAETCDHFKVSNEILEEMAK